MKELFEALFFIFVGVLIGVFILFLIGLSLISISKIENKTQNQTYGTFQDYKQTEVDYYKQKLNECRNN